MFCNELKTNKNIQNRQIITNKIRAYCFDRTWIHFEVQIVDTFLFADGFVVEAKQALHAVDDEASIASQKLLSSNK